MSSVRSTISLIGTLVGDGDVALMAKDDHLHAEVLDKLPILTLESAPVLEEGRERRPGG
jgi:hypothetical protein